MKSLHNRINKVVLKENLSQSGEKRITLSFYKYAYIGNTTVFRDHFYLLLDSLGVYGRIYVASEGINAQISVAEEQFAKLKEAIFSITFLEGCRLNVAIEEPDHSFYKLVIKIKHKIVADGLDDDTIDYSNHGQHLDAEQFNKLTEQQETVIVDMRNHYESEVGHFQGAICPDVETFRESLPIVEEMLTEHKEKNIVMYCTGGIRCEKASAFLKNKGFEKVHQLDGGIIEYARQVEKLGLKNKFVGKNFVFDDRLGERISEDIIAKCHQCGDPCDQHTNCKNDACHILFIQCDSCQTKYQSCCSQKCTDFLQLPEEQREKMKGTTEFNGTRFGKGRYKAHHQNDQLTI